MQKASAIKLPRVTKILFIVSAARVTGVRVVALSSTAVTVSWTPVTLPAAAEYHYTVHYTTVCGTVNISYPASSSSGVVSGLQEGLQYQFSVSVTFNVSGVIYTCIGRELNIAKTCIIHESV